MTRLGADVAPDTALLDAWNAVLDDFEAAVERALGHAARAGDAADEIDTRTVFVPPASMPPMPAAVVERARALLARNGEALAEVGDIADRIRPANPSSAIRRPPSSQRSTSSFDTRA